MGVTASARRRARAAGIGVALGSSEVLIAFQLPPWLFASRISRMRCSATCPYLSAPSSTKMRERKATSRWSRISLKSAALAAHRDTVDAKERDEGESGRRDRRDA